MKKEKIYVNNDDRKLYKLQINCVIRECVICVVFIILISEGVKVLTSMLVAIMTWLQ